MSPGWTREEVVGAKGFEPTSSELAGVGPNRRKSASSDQIGLIRFSFSFLFLLAFCSFSRRSYDTYMTLADPSGRNRMLARILMLNRNSWGRFANSSCPVCTHHVSCVLNNLARCQLQKGKAELILVSSHSVRKRLSLLALALTMPFNCPPPESLRHGKGDRDHIVFLELHLYIGGSVKGYSFSIYAHLCSLFRQKSRQRESSGL